MKYILILAAICLVGCTKADITKAAAFNSKHKITLYSGGVAVRTWHSTGGVSNEGQSDDYYFQDSVTLKLVRVSGQLAIEQE